MLYLLQLKPEDSSLGSELKVSPEMIEYAVAAWTAAWPVTGKVYLNAIPGEICPIIHLLSRLLFHEETRQVIFDLLYSPGRKNLRAKVIEATIFRCRMLAAIDRSSLERQLAGSIAQGVSQPPPSGRMSIPWIIFINLEGLVRLVQGLSEHSDMRMAVRKSTFFEEFFRVLDIWLLEKTDRDRDGAVRYEACKVLCIASCLVERWPSSTHDESTSSDGYRRAVVTACLGMVRGGFTSVLIESMRSVAADEEEPLGYLSESMTWLRDACNQHPSLSQLVYSELVELLGGSFWMKDLTVLGEPSGHFLELALDVAAANDSPSEGQHSLCDNLHVRLGLALIESTF